MATLSQHFERFLENISLNQGQIDRAHSGFNGVQRFLQSDQVLAPMQAEVFLQGSFANGTVIKPQPGQHEFDVDAVVVLDVSRLSWAESAPANVIDLVARRLRTTYNYEGKASARPRCARIEFAGDFHLDLVPCKRPALSFGATPPKVSNPSLPDENLARAWTDSDFNGFKANIGLAARKARKALVHPGRDDAVRMWRDLFGDRFPVQPHRLEGVNSSGVRSSAVMPKHRWVRPPRHRALPARAETRATPAFNDFRRQSHQCCGARTRARRASRQAGP